MMPTIRLRKRPACLVPFALSCLLALAGAAVEILSGADRKGRGMVMQAFDLDTEGNVPTLASAGMLAVAALLAAMVAGRPHQKPAVTAFWGLSAAGLGFLSLDELFGFHNRLGRFVPDTVGDAGVFTFRWTAAGVVGVGLAVLVMVPLLRHLPCRTILLLTTSAVIYLSGALGMEMAAGYLVSRPAANPWFYSLVIVTEEALEMLGISLLIAALIDHVERQASGMLVWRGLKLTVSP